LRLLEIAIHNWLQFLTVSYRRAKANN